MRNVADFGRRRMRQNQLLGSANVEECTANIWRRRIVASPAAAKWTRLNAENRRPGSAAAVARHGQAARLSTETGGRISPARAPRPPRRRSQPTPLSPLPHTHVRRKRQA